MRNSLITRPLYQALRNRIASEIVREAYPAGSLLPSLKEISKNYHVSIDTANRALKLLAKEGLISCRSCRRSRVNVWSKSPEHKYRIGLLINSADEFGVFDYHSGPSGWLLHQNLLDKLLNDHNHSFTFSLRHDWEKYVDKVDGMIVLGAIYELFNEPEKLIRHNIPFVRIQTAEYMPSLPESNTVYIDYGDSCRKLAVYFLANGVKRFFIQNFERVPQGGSRFRELFKVLFENGINQEQITSFTCNKKGFLPDNEFYNQLKEAFSAQEVPIGIFCNDIAGREVLKWILEAGGERKKDFFLAGSADFPSSDNSPNIELTASIAQFADLSNTALEMLYAMIEEDSCWCLNRAIPECFKIRDT